MRKEKRVTGGVYLVLDPGMEKTVLLPKLKDALEGGVKVLQIWNNWPAAYTLSAKKELVQEILNIASAYEVPVLINEEWELLKNTALAGVHFDVIPEDYAAIKSGIGRDFICGITCSNNLEVIHWAEQNQADYISFCAMFPSGSVSTCEIVSPETVKRTREITQIPIFLSGGITAENMGTLKEIDFAGVAVISGILGAASPKASTSAYTNALYQLKK